MSQETLVHNPFMMMLRPDIVLAAIERSEKLGRLNRRMCHPLDRQAPASAASHAETVDAVDDADPAGVDGSDGAEGGDRIN